MAIAERWAEVLCWCWSRISIWRIYLFVRRGALIGNSSPVARSSSPSNHMLISLRFWFDSVTDHSAHIPLPPLFISQLEFTPYIKERVRRVRIAELQIKGLTRTNGLVPGRAWRIKLQLFNLRHYTEQNYGGEIKKTMEQTIQQPPSRQARSITGMYPSTPIHPL